MRTARSFGSIDRALVALAGVSGTILAILWWGTVIVLGAAAPSRLLLSSCDFGSASMALGSDRCS